MSFTLEQLLWAVRTRQIGVTAETSASLVLALAEQLALAPRVVALERVTLTQSGQLLLADGIATSARASDQGLRALLAQLLAHTSGDHPALQQCATAAAEGLEALSSSLLKALVPLNRAAAKRGLARLHRRLAALPPAQLVPGPAEHAVAVVASSAARTQADLTAALCEAVDVSEFLEESVSIPCVEGTPIFSAQQCADFEIDSLSELAYTPKINSDVTPKMASAALGRAIATAARVIGSSWESERTSTWTLPPLPPKGEQTPFLGSIEVSPIATACSPEPSRALAGVAMGQQASTRAAAPSARLIFGRFTAKRSDVGQLIEDFALESAASDHKVAAALRRCVGLRGGERDASCTPPPVGWLVAAGPLPFAR
jgi:hypothetical protein